MRQLREHPLRTLTGLLVLAFGFFALSGIPRFRYAGAGLDLVLGSVFWFGFLALALMFVLGGVLTLVRAFAGSRRPA